MDFFSNTELTAFRPSTTTLTSIDLHSSKLTAIVTILDPNENTTIVNAGNRIVDPLSVYWQVSDLSNFDPPYASALASRLKLKFTPTGSLQNIPSAPTSAPASPVSTPSMLEPTSTSELSEAIPAPSSGLSHGATAGISIGAALGAATLTLASFLIYKRTRRKKQEPSHAEESTSIEAPEVAVIQQPVRKDSRGGEVETRVLSELPSPIAELEGEGVWKEGRDKHIASQRDLPASLRAGQEVRK
jgi:hypothetical protein